MLTRPLREPAIGILLLGLIVSELVLVRGALLFAPYYFLEGPSGHDRVYYYMLTRSLVFDGDLEFDNEIALHPPNPPIIPNKFPVGSPLLSLPGFAAYHFLLGQEGDTGYERSYVAVYALSQHFFSLLGVWLSFLCLRYFFDPTSAAVGTVAAWLGSNAIFFTSIDMMMAHAAAIFSIAWCAYESVRFRFGQVTSWNGLRLGFACGFVFVVRHQDAVVWLFPLAMIVDRWRCSTPGEVRWLRLAVLAALGLALALAPHLIVRRMVFGDWLLHGYEGEAAQFDWLHPSWGELWERLRRWVPLLLLSFSGAILYGWHNRGARLAPLSIVLLLLIHLYVNAAWYATYIVSRSWPDPLVFWGFGLAAWHAQATTRRSRLLLAACYSLLAAWNLPFVVTCQEQGWTLSGWLAAVRQLI